jgi:hypothetical protein
VSFFDYYLTKFLVFLIIIACTQGFYASKAYHQKAIAGLFRAPMSFFDSQVHVSVYIVN